MDGIELGAVSSHKNVPQLRLDTSNLRESARSSMVDAEKDGEDMPPSAILGLASNLANNQWMLSAESEQQNQNQQNQRRPRSPRSPRSRQSPIDDTQTIPRLVLNVERSFEHQQSPSTQQQQPPSSRPESTRASPRHLTLSGAAANAQREFDNDELEDAELDASRDADLLSMDRPTSRSYSHSRRRSHILSHSRWSQHSEMDTSRDEMDPFEVSLHSTPSLHSKSHSPSRSPSRSGSPGPSSSSPPPSPSSHLKSPHRMSVSLNSNGRPASFVSVESRRARSRPPSVLDGPDEPMGRSLFCFEADSSRVRKLAFRVVESRICHYLMIALTFGQIITLCIDEGPTYEVVNGMAVVLLPQFVRVYTVFYAVYTVVFVLDCVAHGMVTNEVFTAQDVGRKIKRALSGVLYLATLGALKRARPSSVFKDPLSWHKCVLRSSWGRVEAISLVFFWTFRGLAEGSVLYSLYLFVYGIAHLRILRFLDYLRYTRTVLHVIKTAIPFLQNVLIFIAFFVSIYTLIGVQSFNGSLRRVCIYGDTITSQHCGSWLNETTLAVEPYMRLDTRDGSYQSQSTKKGYTCPAKSICVELRAFPSSGSFTDLANESFDNIFNSLEIVLIMMSNNGFTDIMYSIIDSEYLVSSLFFITGVFVLGIWLMNLLVAVMVSSYAAVRRSISDDDTSHLRTWIREKLKAKRQTDAEEDESGSQNLSESDIETSRDELQIRPESNMADRDRDTEANGETESVVQAQHRNGENSQSFGEIKIDRWYVIVHFSFTMLALIDLIIQACLTAPEHNMLPWESVLTTAFGIEIVLRFIAFSPHWREFLYSATTLIDIVLVIANIITLVFYYDSEIYSWLTAFQLLRIYRLVGAIKYSRLFWMQVFGNFKIFASLTIFYFGSTLLATLIAAKMLKGQFSLYDDDGNLNMFSFYDLAASFFSMYQVSSTENWTDVLFWTTNNVSRSGGNVVSFVCIGILLFGWLFFANFLVLNLFIGVMSENLHGSIVNKREEQVRRFAESISAMSENDTSGRGLINGETIMPNFDTLLGLRMATHTMPSPSEDTAGYGVHSRRNRHVRMRDRLWAFCTKVIMWEPQKKHTIDPMRAAVEQKFVIEFLEANGGLSTILQEAQEPKRNSTFLSLNEDENINSAAYGRFPLLKKLKSKVISALGYLHHYPPEFRLMLRRSFEMRRQQAIANSSVAFIEAMFETNKHKLTVLEEYCTAHPSFDKSLFIFGIHNPVRRFFQHIFSSSNGTRRSKINPGRWVDLFVWLFFMSATLCIVVLTCVDTPLDAINAKYRSGKWTLVSMYDVAFGVIFLVEFLGKTIADGFHFTPNAYTWSMWNNADLIVLISIWVTFINDTLNGPLSRYVRALMALRALRLLGFYLGHSSILSSAIKHGFRNIFGAVIILMSIVIPYSVWGKNIFRHRLSQCNDGNINYFAECSGEYTNTVFDNFEVLSPRAVTGNYFNYDNFWSALLIQFGVLSLEGWVDVMQAVASISSTSQQSTTFASKGNALYAILYNYIGTVLIITMMIAVIIRNYAIITGTAFLTEQQLSWLDVKRTLGLVKPTPRPPRYRQGSVRAQILSIMPTWIQFLELFALLMATMTLAAYFYPMKPESENVYQLIQLACSMLLVLLGVIRLIVLRPALFCHSWWNPFGLLVCTVVMVLTIVILVEPAYKISGVDGVSRGAVIAMLLLWIPRTKQLSQFYSIGTAAIREISVLLRAWFMLYIAYAIALNQSFGLTKLGSQSTWSKNFRTIPKALIALFFMSCGEGWNQYLMDFVISKPNCLENSTQSECGIPGFAYFLFISWNIVSMYVFANLFISLICEGCWYVYRSGPVNINEMDIVNLLEAWQQFDPRGTGMIRTRDLYRFLGRSQGYFSIGIYSRDPVYNVRRIIAETNADVRSAINPYDVDYEAINAYISEMPAKKFRQRRAVFELFAAQARLISEAIPGGSGIRFSKLVLMFPLYKDMDPAESLTLTEFIELKAKLYEASVVIAAEFIAATWRAKRFRQQSMRRSSSVMITPYSEEPIQ